MNGIEFYPLFDNERIYSTIDDVEPLSDDYARRLKILRDYPDEAYPIYERIKERYGIAMELNKSIERQFREYKNGKIKSLFAEHQKSFEEPKLEVDGVDQTDE